MSFESYSLYEPTFPASIKALESLEPIRAEQLKKYTRERWQRASSNYRNYGSMLHFASYTVKEKGIQPAKPRIDYSAELLGREKSPYLCGIELEIEHRETLSDELREKLSDLLSENLPGSHYVCTDGSLRNGVEIVTAPRSETEVRGLYFNFYKLLKNLSRTGWNSHDSERCGLHVHISKSALTSEQWDQLDKWILRPTIKPLFKKLSRRTGFNWCNFTAIRTNRYRAINHHNSNTVEFRFFRGTLKPESFLGSLETIFALLAFFADSERAKSIRSFVSFLQSDRRYKHASALFLPVYLSREGRAEARAVTDEEREQRRVDRERRRAARDQQIARDLERIVERCRQTYRYTPVGFNWRGENASIVSREYPVILTGTWRAELRERAIAENLTVALPTVVGEESRFNAVRWHRSLSWGRESGTPTACHTWTE